MTPSPQNIAIANHHRSMQRWWTLPKYKQARKEFVIRNPVCIRCGRPTQTPGHSPEDYLSFNTYLSAVETDKCDPLCNACNLMEHKGMKPCPICVKNYHDILFANVIPNEFRKIWYIAQDKEHCFEHRPEEEKIRAEQKKEFWNNLIKKSRKINNAKRRAIYQDLKEKNHAGRDNKELKLSEIQDA